MANVNPNEAAYPGGRKHFTDVIKNSGAGELLVWRQPEEDFNTNSTLIVFPSEEAVFFQNGAVAQVFGEGTHKLSTQNYPFISRLRNAFSGGISTFNCVVYFVRKALSVEIRWGTDSPIQVRDPVQGIATSVRARGAYKIQVGDGAKLVTKLLGNNIQSMRQEEILNYFHNEFQQSIKASLAKAIMASNTEILGIVAQQDTLADTILPMLREPLGEYGIQLVGFSIAGIDIPENDPTRQLLEQGYANKRLMEIMKDDWGRQKAADILEGLANNPGAGGGASAGAGIGMGLAAGGVFGGLAQTVFSPMHSAPAQPAASNQSEPAPSGKTVECAACHAQNPEHSKFCGSCGKKLEAVAPVCPKCGAVSPAGVRFCTQCGADITTR